MSEPEPLEDPDLTRLRSACAEYVKDPNHKHAKQWIFEEALEACYGPTVWDYTNEKLE